MIKSGGEKSNVQNAVINCADISVVVQGEVEATFISQCLNSIRCTLPQATIILSTWKGSNTSGLDFDILIKTKDPGAQIFDNIHGSKNNVNRQIISTVNGLRTVKTKYALKLRSDMALINANFLKYFQKFDAYRNNECQLFENRIIVNNLYCANPKKTIFPLHLSDWVHFGKTSDLLNLWNIPLQTTEQSRYFFGKPRPRNDSISTWLHQFVPEQYIWKSCLEKNHISLELEYFGDMRDSNLKLTELSFANNVVIVDYKDYGIRMLKFDPYKRWDPKLQLNHCKWLMSFKKYCNPEFRVPFKYKIQEIFEDRIVQRELERFNRQITLFVSPVKNIFKWAMRPLLISFHVFKLIIIIIVIILKRDL